MTSQVNYRHGFMPPHVIEKIIERGSEKQKERAIKERQVSGQIRERRQARMRLRTASAVTGESGKNRFVYDAKFGSDLPGILVRSEGNTATGDRAADEAYEGAGQTYDLFYNIFGRNSIDDNGMKLISSVHYLQGYDNAFWDGEQMVYGDGDEDLPEEERLFNRFTIALDIIGHELTHGVTEYTAHLTYQGQAGALNESFSDVFGILVKQRLLNQTADEANWLIGEGLFTGRIKGKALRSMKEPGSAYDDPLIGKDPQPGHMNDYVNTLSDNGGVHINSGIPNRAFCTVALNLGGFAWEKAGRIWYLTLRDKLTEKSDFQDAADKTWQTAVELFGKSSLEQEAVVSGWKTVGITVNSRVKIRCIGRIKNLWHRLWS
ncbi:MAG: M4 family metallopeptidase [Bacteroidales bacterium]|nr:M4 family metallopeptidase [Bacteroidales bacterium]